MQTFSVAPCTGHFLFLSFLTREGPPVCTAEHSVLCDPLSSHGFQDTPGSVLFQLALRTLVLLPLYLPSLSPECAGSLVRLRPLLR